MVFDAEALRYPVRPRVLLRHLGVPLLALACLCLVPLAVSLLFAEFGISLRYVATAVGLGLLGYGLQRLPGSEELTANEGFCIAGLLFLLAPLSMTFPLAALDAPYLDVLFESVSGVTTTGLSTLASVENVPNTFLFARAWMQWYGGLGIVILSLALVVGSGQSAKSLAMTESEPPELMGGVKHYARNVLLAYLVLTCIVVAGAIMTGAAPYPALLYGLAAVSTGGFAPADASLAALGAMGPQAVIMLGCLAGALPLTLFWALLRRRRLSPVHRAQLLALLVLTLALGLILSWSLQQQGRAPGDSAWHAALLALSAQSTAGFSSVNVGELGPLAKGALVLFMLIGGGVGSTAGGFKVLRLMILVVLVRSLVRRVNLARHAVHRPALMGQRMEDGEMREAAVIALLYAFVLGVSWLVFLAHGIAPLDALFEVASALGTVGLSSGISRPELAPGLKLVLCVDMLLGRLEIFAWLVLFSPGTWFRRRQ